MYYAVYLENENNICLYISTYPNLYRWDIFRLVSELLGKYCNEQIVIFGIAQQMEVFNDLAICLIYLVYVRIVMCTWPTGR